MTAEEEIRRVFARYVRATDARDGAAQGALFTDDAVVEILARVGPDSYEPVGEPLIGGAGVRYAVENFMPPHVEGRASHHVTADHLIEVSGDEAHFNAQYIVFDVQAEIRPADGWPVGAFGTQGSLRTTESGYYDTRLRRVDGEWKIIRHRVLGDLPMALPDN